MQAYHVVEQLIEELERFNRDASAGVDTTRLDALLNHPDLGNLRLKVFASRIHDFLESSGNPALYRTTNDYGDCTWNVIIDDLGEVLWLLNEDDESGDVAAQDHVDSFQEEYDFLSAAANAQNQLLLTRHLLELTANLEPRTKTESTQKPIQQADDGDGFSVDKRCFQWRGKKYYLNEKPSSVIEVLYNGYLNGKGFLHEQYIKVEAEVESDIRTLVRDNELKELIVRLKDDNGNYKKGFWGLSTE